MRSVRRAGRVVDKERPVRGHRFFGVDIPDDFLSEGVVECVSTFLTLGNFHLYRRRVTKQRRRPLVGFAADEAVEVIEALQRRPTVVGAGDAGFPVGDLMVFPDILGAVTVLAQDFRHHRGALGNLAGIPGIGVREFRDHSHAY